MKDTIWNILTIIFFLILQTVVFLITPNNWIRVVAMPIVIGAMIFVVSKKFGIR
ncbi:hypothetical protein Q7A53_10020 [Halobacillus rhizosphaerae]|uniref:hypothetical protein n=1 Tax=Halobacillus rhizosphaerae TaxID=3064889 RepID=UPI00398A8C0F